MVPPFFIVGCPRSGTTLAAQILDSHSRLAVFLEMNYYGTFWPLLPMYGDLGRERCRRRFIADVLSLVRMQHTTPPSLRRVEQRLSAPTFEGVFEALLALYAESVGKVRGGEKTPLQFAFLDQIASGFPTSPIVFLMRDPRDVAMSMSIAWRTPIAEATRIWNQAYLTYAESDLSSVHLLRYEELVADPMAGAHRLCDALGEPFDPDMLELSQRLPDQLRAIRHIDPSKLSGPVVPTSVGTHERLPIEVIREIERRCAEGMDAMGYVFESGRPPSTPPPTAERVGRVPHLYERLRYHGLNVERWRRTLFRWRLIIRVRIRHSWTIAFGRSNK